MKTTTSGLAALLAALALTGCDASAPTSPPAADAPAPAPAPAPRAAPAVAPAPYHADFDSFFEDFRAAVLADDREAVAGMTLLPFIDFNKAYCEERDRTRCPSPPDSATARDKAEFLAKYDLIFTPQVIAAVRARKVREGVPEDENTAPAVGDGEYYLDIEDIAQQRVFSREGGDYRMSRVPFYS